MKCCDGTKQRRKCAVHRTFTKWNAIKRQSFVIIRCCGRASSFLCVFFFILTFIIHRRTERAHVYLINDLPVLCIVEFLLFRLKREEIQSHFITYYYYQRWSQRNHGRHFETRTPNTQSTQIQNECVYVLNDFARIRSKAIPFGCSLSFLKI